MRVFWKAKDLLRRFHDAVLGQQVILAVREATSGTALTGVADLEAGPDELDPARVQALPSMQMLEGSGLQNASAVIYNSRGSRVCRPCQWCFTVTSMIA